MAFKFDDMEDEALVAEINITPLTDIFLVLLIIFMISSSAMIEGGLQVKLPTAKSSGVNKPQTGKPIYVTISKDGKIQVNDQTAPEESLTAVIKQQLEKTTEKTVVIRGDETIFLGKAVKIMDAARGAGADKIAIATQPPNK